MHLGELIGALPLWAVFALTFAICLAATEAGATLAELALRQNAKEPESPLGSAVGALLGLLAFFLAFTFGMTAARFDARKQLVLQEANAIGTTYLRAGLLPQPQRSEVRRLLREYTEGRLNPARKSLAEVLRRSVEIHASLWSQAESLVPEQMDSQLRALFITSLNETIDLHQSRVTVGLQYRIPRPVWWTVYLLTGLSMLAVGYQIAMSGTRRLRSTPVLAAALSLVILIIADIDRPSEGLLQVDQQPIADVLQTMPADSP